MFDQKSQSYQTMNMKRQGFTLQRGDDGLEKGRSHTGLERACACERVRERERVCERERERVCVCERKREGLKFNFESAFHTFDHQTD